MDPTAAQGIGEEVTELLEKITAVYTDLAEVVVEYKRSRGVVAWSGGDVGSRVLISVVSVVGTIIGTALLLPHFTSSVHLMLGSTGVACVSVLSVVVALLTGLGGLLHTPAARDGVVARAECVRESLQALRVCCYTIGKYCTSLDVGR